MSQSQCHEKPGVQPVIPPRGRKGKQPSQRRPPSATDLQVYERAVIQEVPQRAVGTEFGISQGAVSRKCAKVIAWVSRCGREELGGMTEAERLRYLVRFAERKYDWYREVSEAAHQQSLQDQVILVESGTREAKGNPGEFVGTVKIRKTTRPQTGKSSHIREARLALDSLVLLGWGCVGRRDLELVPDPDEVAQQKQEEQLQQMIERNRRLEWELNGARTEIDSLRQEMGRGRESLAPHDSPYSSTIAAKDSRPPEVESEQRLTNRESPEAGLRTCVHSVASSGGRESFAADVNGGGEALRAKDSRPRTPPEGLSSREGAADGVAFMAEVQQLIASLEPANGYEETYRDTLQELWKNMRHNHRHHGIIPERQKLPSLKCVSRGGHYMVTVPYPVRGGPKSIDTSKE